MRPTKSVELAERFIDLNCDRNASECITRIDAILDLAQCMDYKDAQYFEQHTLSLMALRAHKEVLVSQI